YDPFGGDPFKG
nr:Chain B, Epidermal growth factor receptor substrate 15 [Homo sapiens]